MHLTYKAHGKTVTEALPSQAAVRKTEQEIAELRNYQQLGHDRVDVSEQLPVLGPRLGPLLLTVINRTHFAQSAYAWGWISL